MKNKILALLLMTIFSFVNTSLFANTKKNVKEKYLISNVQLKTNSEFISTNDAYEALVLAVNLSKMFNVPALRQS